MKKHLFWIIPVLLILGIVIGLFLSAFGENQLMGDYDLYNCIYVNAERNSFNQNPVMIDKIQEECICFRKHNYTNLIEADCSLYSEEEKEQ